MRSHSWVGQSRERYNTQEAEDAGKSECGGNLSPLLANIYLNEFEQEFQERGVPRELAWQAAMSRRAIGLQDIQLQ